MPDFSLQGLVSVTTPREGRYVAIKAEVAAASSRRRTLPIYSSIGA
jgi:hypothetical protein